MTESISPIVCGSSVRFSGTPAKLFGPIVGAIFATCCLGCGPQRGQSATDSAAVLKFIEGEAGDRAEAVAVDDGPAFRWQLTSPGEIERWTMRDLQGAATGGSSFAVLTAIGTDPRMFRSANIRASLIDTIEVVCDGLEEGDFAEVFWAGQHEEFGAERRISVRVEAAPDRAEGNQRVVFNLRGHPLWKGKINRIRFDLPQVTDRIYRVKSIIGSRSVARKDAVIQALGKNWRADYEGEVRTVRLAPPTHYESWHVKLPDDPMLRFSFLLEPGSQHAVKFRVRVFKGEAGGRQVFEDLLTPAADIDEGLVERTATVDLSSFSNQEVLIRFETESEVGVDDGVHFPAWANVEILDRSAVMNRPNVILIDLDTLRADRLSAYGYSQHTSPMIDDWASQSGVVFDHVIAPAPWTLPSHISMFTGMDCLSHGLNMDDRVPFSLTMLAELMADSGYATKAVTGGGYLSDSFNLMQGFHELTYWYRSKLDPAQTGNDLETGVDMAVDWIRDRSTNSPSEPFFLLLHSYEVHVPYHAREPYFSTFLGESPDAIVPPVLTRTRPAQASTGFVYINEFTARRSLEDPSLVPVKTDELSVVNALYDSGVAYADQHVGRLLTFLRESGLAERTIVILTSDHGESLGERGLAGHSTLEEWEIHVPLIISGPSIKRSRAPARVATQVRTVDIAPTILDLVGLKPMTGIDGASLRPLLSDDDSTFQQMAVSYAASTNNGVSLWLPNFERFLFNNSPWTPVWGLERAEEVGSVILKGAGQPSVDSLDEDRLRALLVTEFARKKVGLRMRVVNPDLESLVIRMRGAMVTPFRVKSFDVGSAVFSWQPPVMQIEIPTSGALDLFIEGLAKDRILLQLGRSTGLPTSTSEWEVVDLGDGSKEWALIKTSDRLAAIDDNTVNTDTDTAVVRIWFQGLMSDGAGESVLDDETAEALRNLGYIQ